MKAKFIHRRLPQLRGSGGSGNVGSFPVCVDPPSIFGSIEEGETLSSFRGMWTGNPAPKLSLQWQRNGQDVEGALTNFFKLTTVDAGTKISLKVTASSSTGSSVAFSSEIGPIISSPDLLYPPVNVSLPVVSGISSVGNALFVSEGTWAGNPAPLFSFRWYREGVLVPGEESQSFVLTPSDAGSQVSARVIATNPVGTSESSSGVTNPVTWIPSNVTAPEVSGLPFVGEVLVLSSVGSWTGYPSPSFSYQWVRDGEDVEEETGEFYEIKEGDLWSEISVRVTGTNLVGSVVASSEAVEIIADVILTETGDRLTLEAGVPILHDATIPGIAPTEDPDAGAYLVLVQDGVTVRATIVDVRAHIHG